MTTNRRVRDAAREAVRAVERLCVSAEQQRDLRTASAMQLDLIEHRCGFARSSLDTLDAAVVAAARLLASGLRGVRIERADSPLAVPVRVLASSVPDVARALEALEAVVARCDVAIAMELDEVEAATPQWARARRRTR